MQYIQYMINCNIFNLYESNKLDYKNDRKSTDFVPNILSLILQLNGLKSLRHTGLKG